MVAVDPRTTVATVADRGTTTTDKERKETS
jgi:hypothetical protein